MLDSGIVLQGGNAANNQIYGNIFQNTNIAINIAQSSTGNIIHSNSISLNQVGIKISHSSGNTIYWNNFINNIQVSIETYGYDNIWDNGYPSGGNYWGDYKDKYPGAGEYGTSGIWNIPYVIDDYNVDNYPLMQPVHEIAVTQVTLYKTVVGQGYSLKIDVTLTNQGRHTETLELTLYGNTPVVAQLTSIFLTSRQSTTITLTWDTTGFAKGNYNLRAYVTPVTGEVNINDNDLGGGTVMVTIPGDINGDKTVNALDLYVLSKVYGTKPSNPNANINNDDIVNKLDLEIISQNYGKIWP
jgi:parallel beta-helix repeat protein